MWASSLCSYRANYTAFTHNTLWRWTVCRLWMKVCPGAVAETCYTCLKNHREYVGMPVYTHTFFHSQIHTFTHIYYLFQHFEVRHSRTLWSALLIIHWNVFKPHNVGQWLDKLQLHSGSTAMGEPRVNLQEQSSNWKPWSSELYFTVKCKKNKINKTDTFYTEHMLSGNNFVNIFGCKASTQWQTHKSDFKAIRMPLWHESNAFHVFIVIQLILHSVTWLFDSWSKKQTCT